MALQIRDFMTKAVFAIFVILICSASMSAAQTTKRHNQSKILGLLEAFSPDSTGGFLKCFPLAESNCANEAICFYIDKAIDPDTQVPDIKTYLVKFQKNSIKNVTRLDTYRLEGTEAIPLKVFSVKMKNSKAIALVVLCSRPQNQLGDNGVIYKMFVYNGQPNEFLFSDLSLSQSATDLFGVEYEGVQMGVQKKAKYKTESAMKMRLRKFGFIQEQPFLR